MRMGTTSLRDLALPNGPDTSGSARSHRSRTPPSRPGETSRFWVAEGVGDVELLFGRYRKQRFVPHTHDAYSLGIIMHGALQYDYRGSVYTARAGSISVIEPGEVHTGHAGGEDGWTYRNFFIGADLMSRLADEVHGGPGLPCFAEPLIEDDHLARELFSLHRKLEASPDRLEPESMLLASLGRLLARHSTRRPNWIEPSDRPAVSRARDYLRARLAENPSLEEVAGVAGYSPFHFLRIFRREFGLTPHAYLLQARIEKVADLLKAGRSLVGAALDCGFSDQSHMTRRFKQVMGVTPGQFVGGRNIIQES